MKATISYFDSKNRIISRVNTRGRGIDHVDSKAGQYAQEVKAFRWDIEYNVYNGDLPYLIRHNDNNSLELLEL